MSPETRFFQAGGVLDEDAPCYIERPADERLMELVERGELCLVLAPRQTGKSSLIVHAFQKLAVIGIRCAYVDLQALGSYRDPDTWFSNIADEIERELELGVDALKWWHTHQGLGPTMRFTRFLEDVVLEKIPGRVAVCFDEIDSALSLSFSDDFFTTVRAMVNARSHKPKLKRLNFVLVGTATPSEFIKNRSRTPFNIGTEIALTDFDPDALGPFRNVLGPGSESLVERIFYWTSGQPLMVQRLAELGHSLQDSDKTADRMDALVRDHYLEAKIEKRGHLQFIQDYLLKDPKQTGKVLRCYKAVLKGKRVPFRERSPVHAQLQLAGVTRVSDDVLQSRNRIYRNVFDVGWIKENKPRDLWKTLAAGTMAALMLVLLWFLVVKPYYLPDFIPFQELFWADEDIHYTEKTSLPYTVPAPEGKFRKIRVLQNGRVISSHRPSQAQGPRVVHFYLQGLDIRRNSIRVQFYGTFREKSYEKKITVACFPEEEWKMPDLEMVDIPSGCFQMGCIGENEPCAGDEKPVHQDCLSSFKMGRYEVTQIQWENLMGYNPSGFNTCGEDCPVENVSWRHVQEFLRRLNHKADFQYRLPTEAEWEYAARAGTKTAYHWGDNPDCSKANYGNSSISDECKEQNPGRTMPVASFPANAWGIYDMHGNVWEWCQDWYDPNYYGKSPEVDPRGPGSGAVRVLRGGSWLHFAGGCRSAYRGGNVPVYRYRSIGFRLVRSLP